MGYKIILDNTGRCVGYGMQDNWPYDAPSWIDFMNFNLWTCNNIPQMTMESSWTQSAPPPPDNASKQQQDIAFGNSLIAEFNTSEQETAVDSATYQAIIDVFKYVLFALQMGNLVQAKTQILAISTTAYAPVWDINKQTYFVNKINTYLGG